MTDRRRNRQRAWPVLAIFASGCAGFADFNVAHPELAAAEHGYRSTSDRAYFDADDAAAAYVVDLPLPGSVQGRHQRLYLRLDDRFGDHEIGQTLTTGGFAAGFLVQPRGRRAGMTELVAGSVTIEPVGFSGDQKRRGNAVLTCSDGTTLTGRFLAERKPRIVREVESDSTAVQQLIAASTPPAD
ncbi:MAG: hypothetical protein V3T70_02285 [Phycisphaerae bacterium]